MMKISHLLAVGLLSSLFALAQAEDGPCKADVQKFCKDVKPGGGRIIKCLKENEDKLSDACKAQKGKGKAALNEIDAACKGDIETLCKGMERGGGRIAHCLKENREKVSEGCKSAMKKHHHKKE